jgi:hypothetical protein
MLDTAVDIDSLPDDVAKKSLGLARRGYFSRAVTALSAAQPPNQPKPCAAYIPRLAASAPSPAETCSAGWRPSCFAQRSPMTLARTLRHLDDGTVGATTLAIRER